MQNKVIIEFKSGVRYSGNVTLIDVDLDATVITEGFAKFVYRDEVGNTIVDLFNVDDIHAVRYVHYKETE